jgi:hypothetical protein
MTVDTCDQALVEPEDGTPLPREWERQPIHVAGARQDAAAVRILVLWNAARGVAPGEDTSWACDQAQRVGACPGVAAFALHPVKSAAVPHPKPSGWCLELRIAQGHEPSEVIGAGAFAEFLGDMRLLGMRPQLLAIHGELP